MNTLEQLKELRNHLTVKRNRLAQRLEKLDHELDSVNTTISLLDDTSRPKGDTSIDLHVFPEEIKGMTQEEALVLVAVRNGNILKATPARHLLIEAGLIKNAKNAPSIMYTTIDRSGRFERAKRGEYKLLTQSKLPKTAKLASIPV